MPNYKIVHRGPALNQKREVRVSATGTATPAGFTVLAASVALDQTNKQNLFHLVRDELYKIGVQNTQDLILTYEGIATVPGTDFHVWEKDVYLKVGQVAALKALSLLVPQADVAKIAVSANTGIATVAGTGEDITITAVAKGETRVTITALGKQYLLLVHVTPAVTAPVA